MKKMKGFRALVALLLAVMMALSAVAVFADEPETKVEVYDLSGNKVDDPQPENGKIDYGGETSDYSQVVITDVASNTVVNINGDKVSYEGSATEPNDAINIADNHGDINIKTDKVIESEQEDGIEIAKNHGRIYLTDGLTTLDVVGKNDDIDIQENSGGVCIYAETIKGETGDGLNLSQNSKGEVLLMAGNVSGGDNGIEIGSNDGEVTIYQYTNNQVPIISGENEGIRIKSNNGKITINDSESFLGNVIGKGNNSDGIMINSNEQGGIIDLSYNEVTGKQNGIEIRSNARKIDIDANSVEATNGDGIRIASGSSNGSVSNTGEINIDTIGNVLGGESGIQIVGNAGNVNINMDDKKNLDRMWSEGLVSGLTIIPGILISVRIL